MSNINKLLLAIFLVWAGYITYHSPGHISNILTTSKNANAERFVLNSSSDCIYYNAPENDKSSSNEVWGSTNTATVQGRWFADKEWSLCGTGEYVAGIQFNVKSKDNGGNGMDDYFVSLRLKCCKLFNN